MKKNGWMKYERHFYARYIISNLNLFKEVLNEARLKRNQLSCIDIVISYSQNDRLLADYIRLLLNTAGFISEIRERDNSKSISVYLSQVSSLTSYFLLVPSTYGKILSKEGLDFRQEVELLASQKPKFKIVLTYGFETDKRLVEMLSDDLKELGLQNIQTLDMDPLNENLVASSKNMRISTMPYQFSEPVTEIMTPVSKLNIVTMSSTVADVYFKIYVGGARQCIVIDSKKNLKCLRVISVRDLASKVPPGLTKITDQVRENMK